MFQTARWRLVAWNVLVFGSLLMLLGIAAYGVFASRIYSPVDADLQREGERVLNALPQYQYQPYWAYQEVGFPVEYHTVLANPIGQVNQATGCNQAQILIGGCTPGTMQAVSQDGVQAVVQAVKGRHLASLPAQPVQTVARNIRTVTFQQQPWRVLTFGIAWQGTVIAIFQIARVASGEVTSLAELRVLLIFGGLLGILLAAFASLFLADRALVPIRQAFARQRQFTADASHELRTPLALIRANAEMLYRHNDSPADGELVGEIIRETDHLNRLVGDLLTLARADADSLKLIAKPVDFRSLVAAVHEDLSAIAASRGIDTNLALDGQVIVSGDEGRLRQLLLILLDNALKYTDPGGRVDVSVRREDNRARLVISDTGIGIPPADLPHIFERFYRVDRAREHESGGTGLGLAIARWIVQAHHGSIKVDSETGRGSRFQVDLPVG